MNENQARIKQQADKRRDALSEDFLDTTRANEATWAAMSEEEREAARHARDEAEQVEPSFDASKPLHAW